MTAAEVISGKRLWSVEQSDAAAWLRTLPDGVVQTCVTSPPYFGLRDYGTGEWTGGDAGCDHQKMMGGTGSQGLGKSDAAMTANVERSSVAYREECGKCGARRVDSQIGLEPTPVEFVAKLVEVFREVRRVLADDGTCWVNMGDSYAGSGKGGNPEDSPHQKQRTNAGSYSVVGQTAREAAKTKSVGDDRNYGHKQKDLLGIPWRLAFALQADGWYLRQDIIWSKPNPMPESVTDRCTKAHEYVFLLAKSQRYYFDAEAIAEPAAYAGEGRGGSTNRYEQNTAGMDNKQYDTRNKRSVWTVCPASYKGAHFATFPPSLIEPCILAGSRPGDIVIEPFTGSGTTLAVAVGHGRRAIGSELNPEYIRLIKRRMSSVTLPLPTN